MFVPCHVYENEPQVQKVMLVDCDSTGGLLVCLACRKTDVLGKIGAVYVTLNAAVIRIIFVLYSPRSPVNIGFSGVVAKLNQICGGYKCVVLRV